MTAMRPLWALRLVQQNRCGTASTRTVLLHHPTAPTPARVATFTSFRPSEGLHVKETQQHEHATVAPSALKYGDEGSAVQELQQQLRHIGYCDMDGPVNADGDFGRRTHHAVTAFQRDYGLIADGIAGPKTWQALRHAVRHFARKRSRLG